MIKLSALRITPELDASKYTPGAGQVIASNNNIAASADRAGVAMDGATGSVSRLGQSYVAGYAQQVKFEKGLNALDRALATGNATMAQAEAILEGMARKTNLMANADDLAAQGKTQLAAAVAAVNARLAAEEGLLDQNTNAHQRNAQSLKLANAQRTNLIFQLNDIGVSLAGGMNPLLVIAQQGSQIATIWGPGEGGIGRAFSETGKLAAGMVTKFWPVLAVVGAATALVAGLTHEINQLGGQQVNMGDVALAGWELFAEGITRFAQPALAGIAGFATDLWEASAPVLKDFGNYIVGSFDLAYRNVKTIWSMLPSALGDITISTANAVIDGIEQMINGAIGLINQFTGGAREALKSIGIDIGNIGEVSLAGFDNPYAGAADKLGAEMFQNQMDVGGTDYMGDAFGALTTRSREIHNRPSAKELKEAQKEAERAAEAYDKLIKKTDARIEQLGVEAEALGMTEVAAMALRNTQSLLAEAEATGVKMTPERVAQITALADAITDAELTLKGLHIALENRSPWQVMADEVENLNELMARGKITAEDYWVEVGKAAETMVGTYASSASNILDSLGSINDARSSMAKEAIARMRDEVDAQNLSGQALIDAQAQIAAAEEAQAREQFDREKQLAVARAVVAGGEAIVHSYNAGTATGGGPIVGAIFAGIAAAATAAQIAAITSSTYHSTSISNAAGGGASAAAVAQQTSAINLTIRGSGMIDVGDFAKKLEQQIADGGHQGLVKVIRAA